MYHLEEHGDVNAYFAERCKDRMEKYVPKRKGILRGEAFIDHNDCSIHYNQLYASYQYYGMRKDGTHVINPDNYTTPNTGPYWDQLMITAEGKQLVQDMQDYVDSEGWK